MLQIAKREIGGTVSLKGPTGQPCHRARNTPCALAMWAAVLASTAACAASVASSPEATGRNIVNKPSLVKERAQ